MDVVILSEAKDLLSLNVSLGISMDLANRPLP